MFKYEHIFAGFFWVTQDFKILRKPLHNASTSNEKSLLPMIAHSAV